MRSTHHKDNDDNNNSDCSSYFYFSAFCSLLNPLNLAARLLRSRNARHLLLASSSSILFLSASSQLNQFGVAMVSSADPSSLMNMNMNMEMEMEVSDNGVAVVASNSRQLLTTDADADADAAAAAVADVDAQRAAAASAVTVDFQTAKRHAQQVLDSLGMTLKKAAEQLTASAQAAREASGAAKKAYEAAKEALLESQRNAAAAQRTSQAANERIANIAQDWQSTASTPEDIIQKGKSVKSLWSTLTKESGTAKHKEKVDAAETAGNELQRLAHKAANLNHPAMIATLTKLAQSGTQADKAKVARILKSGLLETGDQCGDGTRTDTLCESGSCKYGAISQYFCVV